MICVTLDLTFSVCLSECNKENGLPEYNKEIGSSYVVSVE